MTDITRGGFVKAATLGAGVAVLGAAGFAGTARAADGVATSAAADSAKGDKGGKDDCNTFDYEFDGVKTKTVRVTAGDNELVGTLQVPASVPETPAHLIFMVHGAQGTRKSDIFENLGLSLAKAGYAAVRFDFHGHGDSEGEFGDSTVETNLQDMDSLIAWAQSIPWVKGISVIGHSIGGAESAMYAARNPDLFEAVMLIAPALNIAETSSGILAGTAERRPWMSDAYVEDGSKFDVFAEIDGFDKPVCVVHGTEDIAVSYDYTMRLFGMIEHCDVHLLSGASHVPNDRMAEIYAIARTFFDRTLGA